MNDDTELKTCRLCKERFFAASVTESGGPVPAEGDKRARVVVIGRNPGINEVKEGRPFVGRAGQKLNKGLALAGIPRQKCWITNVAKCYTPEGIRPSPKCLRLCAQKYLSKELESLTSVRLIITCGNEALQYFEPLATVGLLHGSSFTCGGKELFVTYHPSAACRSTRIDGLWMKDIFALAELVEEMRIFT